MVSLFVFSFETSHYSHVKGYWTPSACAGRPSASSGRYDYFVELFLVFFVSGKGWSLAGQGLGSGVPVRLLRAVSSDL